MAIYKNTSCQTVLRKVMRDLKPEDGNWVDSAVEWTGEALEHIGASAQLESYVCIKYIENHKCELPADLYYINQVSINEAEDAVYIQNEIKNNIEELIANYNFNKTYLENTLTQLANGTITSTLNDTSLQSIGSIDKRSNDQIRTLLANTQVLYNKITHPNQSGSMSTLGYCTSNFPEALHCPDCSNKYSSSGECYIVENNYIKTSFEKGAVCLSYKAFPTDADCYPMIPDDISYKEAIFWYIYKQMLLGGMQKDNGIQYDFADNKWKYYCTQARNAAVYPDIERLENYMNQWVRLIPNINRHSTGFANLNSREALDRGIFRAGIDRTTDIV